MGYTHRKRVVFVLCVFFALLLVVVGKAFKIQVLDRGELLVRSHDQIFRESIIYPRRGNILDRNGKPLAINVQTYSIFTIPKNLKASGKSYRRLAEIVPSLSYDEILSKIKGRQRYTWLARKISLEDGQVEEIERLKGIYIESVPKRIYPNGELLSQVLGFVGIDNVGLSGIEYLFDKELRGVPKVLKYIKDAKGRPIKFVGQMQEQQSHDIALSIDTELQAVVEKYLREAIEKNNADGGGIGVMDVISGEMLALANYPTYNSNSWEVYEERYRKSSFVTDPIEPGSTFKVLTIASALENNMAVADTNFYCEKGELLLDGHIIREADAKKNFEWLSVKEIIKYSSNIGTTKIAFDLTYPKLYKTLRSFNIGEKTGIEIPGESRGIFDRENHISPLRLSNLSFGQGVAVTGIQMLAIYGAIANEGLYANPTIIKGKKREKRVVLSKKTAREIEGMLIEAVEEGTGTNAQVPYFTIAGKTSTAQKPDSSGGYRGYISGFVGYPVNVDKRFVVYVYVDNPKGRHYFGGSVAAPVFKEIARYILYKDKNFSRLAKIRSGGRELDLIDLKQASVREMPVGLVPDFRGLDKKNSKKMAQSLKIDIIDQGAGIVVKQYPEPGEKIEGDTVVSLIYDPPKNN